MLDEFLNFFHYVSLPLSRYNFTVSDKELKDMMETFGGDMTLPENFVQTSPPILGQPNQQMRHAHRQPLTVQVNPQTTLLCTMLEITDPNAKILGKTSQQLLDESASSPAGSLSGGSDEPVDDENGNESGRELPSTIDSSMDLSASSATAFSLLGERSGWDSFHTANESLSDSKLSLPPSASTPLKSSGVGKVAPLVLPPPANVADDDEELLSILSAQKNKSISDSPKKDLSTRSGSEGGSSALAVPQATTASEGVLAKEPSPLPLSEVTPKPLTSTSGDASGLNSNSLSPLVSQDMAQAPCTLSESLSSSPCDSSLTKTSLKAERSSFGMSGLHLSSDLSSSSTSPSSSAGIKRASPLTEDRTSVSTVSSLDPSPTAKKLKRRNVSVYSDASQ